MRLNKSRQQPRRQSSWRLGCFFDTAILSLPSAWGRGLRLSHIGALESDTRHRARASLDRANSELATQVANHHGPHDIQDQVGADLGVEIFRQPGAVIRNLDMHRLV